MAFILLSFLIILAFILGAIYGKGINITINHKGEETGDFLAQPGIDDEEVKNYMEENKGFLKF